MASTVTTGQAGRVAALIGAAALLTSCGMVSALGDEDAGAQTATVAVLVPESGAASAEGEAVLAAVERAIGETADDIGGWTVDVVAVDDGAGDSATAVEVATELVDGDTIAVIGGLSTATVRAVQPVFDDESVLFVSPADVDPTHTRGADPSAPLRPYRSYFRTAVGGETPAAALGRYAVTGLGADAVAVVDGGDPGEVRAFSTAVDDAGGRVVASGSAQRVADVVRTAKDEGATAVYVAGPAEVGVAVADEVRRAGLDAELLGTSAVRGDEFVQAAGTAGEGAVTVASGELEPNDPADAAHDAGTAIGTVLTRCLPPASSASSARRGCVGEMAQLDFAGRTGDVTFDEFGDRVGGVPELSVLRNGQWQPVAPSE